MEETDREVLGSRDPASSLRGRTMAESAVNPRLPDHFTSLNVCLIGLIPTLTLVANLFQTLSLQMFKLKNVASHPIRFPDPC
jgi:hypothetical protein